jgi:hypothetical protein
MSITSDYELDRQDVDRDGTQTDLAVRSRAKDQGSVAIRRERNNRLRAAMIDRKVTFTELATVTGRNFKTVQRWVYEGRIPRAAQAAVIAQYLAIDANWLWPRKRNEVNPDLINLYAHVGEVPSTIWIRSATSARQAIDIAADIAPVLPHDLADDILAERVSRGVQVRLCLADTVLPSVRVPGAWMRINPSRHMLGIYRFDDEMLVWLNRTGTGIQQQAPAMHLRQSEKQGVFDFYRNLFTRLWEDGEAVAHHGDDWYRAAT